MTTNASRPPGAAVVPQALLFDAGLSSHARVLFGILRCCGPESPDRARLAELLGRSKSTVDIALNELCAAGWIEITRRGLGLPNDYRLRDSVG